ncbi:ABC transporter ATP-binding protein [Synechocystis sp. LKSZ1]|uniref:ABC transporter ATP-binding protein n=1 Tax=Synechocystis sp. LKSZ1 TaxID=3144951 RepID=UPI00336C0901
MADLILEVRHLQVEFGPPGQRLAAVKGIDFQLQRGQVLGLVGESGSGKSVTALALMGLVPAPGRVLPTSEIWFAGKADRPTVNLVTLAEAERRRYRGGQMAMIFQEPMSSLNPVYSIGFQIIEAIRLHQQVTAEQAQNQAMALLQEVQVLPRDEALEAEFLALGPHDAGSVLIKLKRYIRQRKLALLKRYPHELSGGQLQRVMIAMAIASNPTLLIADEPTTALDVTVQAEILRLLRDLCKTHRDMSLVFISHDLGVINEIADQVAVMYQGQIVEQGEKDQILHHPQHPYSQGLLACRPRLQPQLAQLPTVADFLGSPAEPPASILVTPEAEQTRLQGLMAQPPLLQVEALTVEFGRARLGGQSRKFKALDQISFQVYPGETLGLVGESGCGKSTLARTLLRLITPRSGRIWFDQQELTALARRSARLRHLRREMQIIFQNPYSSLNPRLSIGQAIQEPMQIHQVGGPKQQRQRVAELLERVGLDPAWFHRYPHELSGGQRQRVCIARALALNPRFIICDESVSALDVSVQAQVLNLLKDLQRERQLTYIFISHDLSVVRFMSDRIMVMNRGQLAEAIAPAQDIITAPQSAYTQKLIASIPQFPDPVV